MLFDCVLTSWYPTVMEPRTLSWVTVTFYFMAAMQALYVSNLLKYASAGVEARRSGVFWLILVGLLIVLGVNKQFDLQSYVAAAARCSAHVNGWYEDRRPWQVLFIVSMAVVFLSTARILPRYLRGAMRQNRWAIIGALFLLAFVLVRATSLHYFDSFINYKILDVRMNWFMEISGLLMIMIQSIIVWSKEKQAIGAMSGGGQGWTPARSPIVAASLAGRVNREPSETPTTPPWQRAAPAYGSSTAAPSMRP